MIDSARGMAVRGHIRSFDVNGGQPANGKIAPDSFLLDSLAGMRRCGRRHPVQRGMGRPKEDGVRWSTGGDMTGKLRYCPKLART